MSATGNDNADPLQTLTDVISGASYAEALCDGSAILAYLGTAILERLGVHPPGKPDVSFDIDASCTITISWRPQ